MNSIKKISVFILLIVLFSACRTTYRGMTTNENHHQTQVVLSENNYKIVKYVEGDASATYFLFFGGNGSERGLVARARENMLREAGLLGKSRAVINETVEKRVKESFFTTEVRYIVSAYVVEFYNPEKDPVPTVEESTYAEHIEQPRTPNVTTQGVTAGIAFLTDQYNIQNRERDPGFHLGYKLEFHNPDIKNFFWATQLNLSYLNQKSFYSNSFDASEHTLGVEIPFLVGLKIPIRENFKWFVSGGPTVGFFLSGVTAYASDYPNGERKYFDTLPSLGAELHSGFQFGKHWQLGASHRWNIGYYDYDHTKVSVGYLF